MVNILATTTENMRAVTQYPSQFIQAHQCVPFHCMVEVVDGAIKSGTTSLRIHLATRNRQATLLVLTCYDTDCFTSSHFSLSPSLPPLSLPPLSPIITPSLPSPSLPPSLTNNPSLSHQ